MLSVPLPHPGHHAWPLLLPSSCCCLRWPATNLWCAQGGEAASEAASETAAPDAAGSREPPAPTTAPTGDEPEPPQAMDVDPPAAAEAGPDAE